MEIQFWEKCNITAELVLDRESKKLQTRHKGQIHNFNDRQNIIDTLKSLRLKSAGHCLPKSGVFTEIMIRQWKKETCRTSQRDGRNNSVCFDVCSLGAEGKSHLTMIRLIWYDCMIILFYFEYSIYCFIVNLLTMQSPWLEST